LAPGYYRQAVPRYIRHLHRAADQHALGGAHQFERGFIDYIKRGNEQRLTMLSDALSEQYAQHGSWAFLRNNDRFIFQLLRTFERDNDDRSPPGHAMKPDAAPDGPPPDGP
jgi:two-component system sensor histidine kinase BaeS